MYVFCYFASFSATHHSSSSPFSVCSTLTAVSQNYIKRNISCNQEYFGVISDDRVVQMALSPIFVSRGFRELDMLDPGANRGNALKERAKILASPHMDEG